MECARWPHGELRDEPPGQKSGPRSASSPTDVAVSGWWVSGYLGLGAGLGAIASLPIRREIGTDNPVTWVRKPAVVSALTAGLFALLAAGSGLGWQLVPYSLVAAVGVPLAVVDIVEQRLPRMLVLPLGVALLLIFTALAVARSDPTGVVRAVLSMAAVGMFHLLLALLVGGMGAGDVRLGAVLGMATGWVGWHAVAGMLLVAYLAAALVLMGARLARRSRWRDEIPFGPFLIAGALVVFVVSG